MTRRAFIVRHGNTFAPGQPPRRIGARTDLPLVESGRAQATALACHFANRKICFHRCLVSPLARTRETADFVAAQVRQKQTEWLREIDHGPDEGKSEDEVLDRIGEAALAAWEARAEPPPGWQVDGAWRVAAWRAWLAEAGDGPDLLVTSSGAARFALLALGLPPVKLRTGAYGELAWDCGSPRLVAWDVRP